MVIKISEEELKFFENIFYLGIGEANPEDINKGLLVLEKIEDIINENKKLEKYYCKRNDCCGRLKENKKITDSEVLIEFEMWLQKELKIYAKHSRYTKTYCSVLGYVLNKLQKLKGDKE